MPKGEIYGKKWAGWAISGSLGRRSALFLVGVRCCRPALDQGVEPLHRADNAPARPEENAEVMGVNILSASCSSDEKRVS